MRILLVEPYFTGSHRAWAEGYRERSRHEIILLTHEGVFWKWRMHGAALTLAAELGACRDRRPFDLVLATSMLNLPAFLGAARDRIGSVPVAIYMHESQLSYPTSPQDRPDLTYPMINWTSAAVADLVVFNSEYHRSVFFEELPAFLGQFPDRTHLDLVGRVRDRSEVLPVGIDLARIPPRSAPPEPPLILWNQRREYDKGPAGFGAAMEALVETGREFRVALAGESFVNEPPEFEWLARLLGPRLVYDGYAPEPEYAQLLARADIVASAAQQEFFGVAVAEAIHAGAFPVLPRRLVYPERIPDRFHDVCLYDDVEGFVDRLAWALDHRTEAAAIASVLRGEVAAFDWSVVAPSYDERFEALRDEG